ncbi:hypothetical protein KXJ69_05480 [Aureisphaera sp. CAU 1614]|uniref:Uncharacterized protein n=1 Tax=Halomarinibacterium sedimenti TaxID=2857106 RepID=A0A9X1JZP9_9FLAO|nr:hypothetical protein [Halomarinibacterium sedimenti]MBW2937546.1 hypothetical protein [Halomarinibacterium sedimenti]
MEEFFASLYEWFGLNPLYSTDMGDQLRGWDITCTDYIGTPWYVIIGWSMIGITIISYALQYHIINSPQFNKKHHWWIMALVIVLLNFLVAFLIPFNSIQSGDFCNLLYLSVSDSIGFGASNAVWSFILFILLTSFKYPRYLGINCRHTTFWKP